MIHKPTAPYSKLKLITCSSLRQSKAAANQVAHNTPKTSTPESGVMLCDAA